MSTSTPWGASDYTHKIAPGIIDYGTPSHGGIHLSETRMAELPPVVREWCKGVYDARWGWFEEDCHWAIVAKAFPKYFTPEQLSSANQTLKSYYPDLWEAWTETVLQPGESRAKDEREFYKAHPDGWFIRSWISQCFADGHLMYAENTPGLSWVPGSIVADTVHIVLRKDGTKGYEDATIHRYFFMLTSEYEACRKDYGLVEVERFLEVFPLH